MIDALGNLIATSETGRQIDLKLHSLRGDGFRAHQNRAVRPGVRYRLPQASCTALCESIDNGLLTFRLDFGSDDPMTWLRTCTPFITTNVTTSCTAIDKYWQLLRDAGALAPEFYESQQQYATEIDGYHRNFEAHARDGSRFDWFEWDGDRLVGHIALYRFSPRSFGLSDAARVKSALGKRHPGIMDAFLSISGGAMARTCAGGLMTALWKTGHPRWERVTQQMQHRRDRGEEISIIPTSYLREYRAERRKEPDFSEITIYEARKIAHNQASQFELLVRSYLPLEEGIRKCRAAVVFGQRQYLVLVPKLPDGYTILRTSEMPWILPLSGSIDSWDEVAPAAHAVCRRLGSHCTGLLLAGSHLRESTHTLDCYIAPPLAFDYVGEA